VLRVEVVVSQAALVQACARLVRLGLGALGLGDPLGLLGARGVAPMRGIRKATRRMTTRTTTMIAMMAPVLMPAGVPGRPGAKLWLA
jgi:hypothetical protein